LNYFGKRAMDRAEFENLRDMTDKRIVSRVSNYVKSGRPKPKIPKSKNAALFMRFPPENKI
jgi:hypothetical protein